MADPRALLDAYGNLYADEPSTGFKRKAAPKAFDALQAVLDLHKPEEFAIPPLEEGDIEFICTDCSAYRPVEAWPCDTVTAITAALEADRG